MGSLTDDRSTFPADPERLAQYDRARNILASAEVPLLYDHTDPRHRVFHALFDGTGNDADRQPNKLTNIGKLRDQLDALPDEARDGGRIAHAYLSGPGTQQGGGVLGTLNKVHDLATGRTFDDRIDRMYGQLVDQVKEWKRTDTWHDPSIPDSDLKVAVVTSGFSRGGVQAMGFQRKVSEEGIVDRDGTMLIPPGKVAIAAVALDPVATGRPEKRDLRPGHDLITMLHIGATDERRRKFPVTEMAPEGVSADGSLIGLKLPGAHGDVGGGPKEPGLSNRAGNLAIAYLNGLHSRPLFEPMPESLREDLNTVHRPDRTALWRVTEIGSGPAPRDTADGVRQEMAPASFRPPTGVARDGANEGQRLHAALDDAAETRRLPQSANAVLGSEYTWRPVQVPLQPTHPDHPDHQRYMNTAIAVERAFERVGSDQRPAPEKIDQIVANLARDTKEAGMTDITLARVENTAQGKVVFAIQGNSADLYDPGNRNTGVPMDGPGLKPTMQAFREMETLPDPQQRQQQNAQQALEATQTAERMAAPMMRRDQM